MNIDLETKATAEKGIRLIKKARAICKTANKTYEFECPHCGDRAGKASINNHIHLRCDKCNISIMQ